MKYKKQQQNAGQKKEFRERYPNLEGAARRHYVLDEICPNLEKSFSSAEFLGPPAGMKEMERCVQQSENLNDFRQKFSRAYNSAKSKGLLKKFEKDLARQRSEKGYYGSPEGIEKIKTLLKIFETRSSFKYAHPDLYGAARRSESLDYVCDGMDYGGGGFNSIGMATYMF